MTRASRMRKQMLPDFSKSPFANPVRHDGTQPPIAGALPEVSLSGPRERFLNTRAYPGNRNVEEHRQKWLRNPHHNRVHLSIGHDFVVFQYTDNFGRVTEEVLLDGNTTCHMHRKGDITLPLICTGKAFQGQGTRSVQEAQARELYDGYNSSSTMKTAVDTLYTAQQLTGYKAETGLFASGHGTSALDFAEGVRHGLAGKAKTLDKVGLAGYWSHEMKDVDAELSRTYEKQGSAKMRTNAGFLGGCLVYLRADRARTLFFMRMYYMSHGAGDNGLPWIGLWEQIKLETKDTGGSRAVTRSVLEKTLYAISRVTEADIANGTAACRFTSILDERRGLHMETFWSKYVESQQSKVTRLIPRGGILAA